MLSQIYKWQKRMLFEIIVQGELNYSINVST